MIFRKEKNNTITLSDRRGFAVAVSLDGFNKINASVDTDSEDFLIEAHMAVLNHYPALFKKKTLDSFVRQFLSIGWLRWHVTKIYKEIMPTTTIEKIKAKFKEILEARSK